MAIRNVPLLLQHLHLIHNLSFLLFFLSLVYAIFSCERSFGYYPKFPMTENGKLDKKQLQAACSIETFTIYAPPRTELEKQLTQLKLEISKNLPGALEDAQEELKIAEREEKERAEFILKMEALIPEMRKKSKELLKKFQEVQPVNDELRQMISGFNMMQTKTGKGMDISGVSSGFQSLDAIIDVLEDEISGVPRTKTMIFYPPNFPL